MREANYRDGLLNGPEILYEDELPLWQVNWIDGQAMKINGMPVYPRLARRYVVCARGDHARRNSSRSVGRSPPAAAADPSSDERLLALRRLNAYRYIAELPADVGLDAAQSVAAESAAKLTASAKSPVAGCSIFTGRGRMPDAIDAISTARPTTHATDSPIAAGASTRPCAPSALADRAMPSRFGVHDDRRKTSADWQSAVFPCRGFMPVEFFSADQSWVALMNPSRGDARSQNV